MREKLNTIFKELFYVFTGALIVFACLELVWQGVVLAYINMNWVLILWLLAGIVVLIINDVNDAN